MVAVISGNGLGLGASSASVLGGEAATKSLHGRGNERIYVNSATGNLIVQNQDEYLAGIGADLRLIRTYNSQGQLTDDNGDNWRLGVHLRLHSLSGTVNTAGSTITKVFGDGAEVVYLYDASSSRYVSSDGDGAHDTLSYDSSSSQWTWTDGSNRSTELYDSNGRLLSSRDADGNTVTYAYTGSLLTQVTDASGQITYLDYAGNNLTQIRTVISGVTQTRTRYSYDGSNRLTQVTVDLSPADNAIADGRAYVTTYTYDGTSKRIASITQSDGNTVSFTYEQNGALHRVKTYTDGDGRISTLTYTGGSGGVTVSANSSVLSTTDTQTSTATRNLNTGVLTTPAAWSVAGLLESSGTAAHDPKVAIDANGNGLAVWREGGSLYARRYTRANNTWATAAEIDTRTNAISTFAFAMDSTTGNAVVAWVQSDGTAESVFVSRYTASSNTWTTPQQVDNLASAASTTARSIAVSIRQSYAAVAWLQSDPANATRQNLYFAATDGTTWSTAALLETSTQSASQPSIDIDSAGFIAVMWRQSDGTHQSIYENVSDDGPPWTWDGPTLWEDRSGDATDPVMVGDDDGNTIGFWNVSNNLYAQRYDVATEELSDEWILDTRADPVFSPSVAIDQVTGDAIAAWVQTDGTARTVYVSRYVRSTNSWTAPVQLESLAGAVADVHGSVAVSIRGGNAAVAWIQADSGNVNSLYAARFSGGSWSAAQLLESSANPALQPSIALDGQGNVTVLWQQIDGSALSIKQARYGIGTGTPYYVVPSGATWASIAQTLYGSSGVAAQLQTALGNPALTAGAQLTSLPASITETITTTVTVPAYYTVPSGATWTSITQAIYGTSDAAAVAALQSAVGNPTLTTGLRLTVPLTLSYGGTGGTATQIDISDPLGLVTTYFNDSAGRLTGVLRPTVNGVRPETRYAYDASGNLTRITEDPSGLNRITTFEYDARGNLTLSRDAAGNTVTRTYSATNQLLTETRYTTPDPDGAGAGQPGGAITARFVYDAEEHLRFVVSADGRVTEHRYDTAGNRTVSLNYTGTRYDLSALTATTALTESQLTTWAGARDLTQLERVDYAYDFRGNLTTATAYGATTTAGAGTTATASVTRYVYDQRGQLLQVIEPRGEATSDASDYLTSYTYDGLGRLLTTTEWLATGKTRTTLNAYDDVNRRTSITLANGLVSTSIYDRAGRLLRVEKSSGAQALGTTTYTYDSGGRLRMVTDPTGIRQHATYDGAGRKQFDVDGDGTLTEYVYGRTGLLVKTIKYAVAANTALLVDGSGNLIASVDVTALRNSAAGSPAADQITRRVYDAASRLVYAIAEDGAVTETRYDGDSRVTDTLSYANRVTIARSSDEVTAASVSALLTTSADDRRTRNFHDADGKLLGTLDAAGYLVEHIYDAAGNLSRTIGYATITPAAQRATGTLAQLRPATDANNDIRSYFFYDGQGRRTGVLDAEGYLTETVYDVAGNVSQTTRYSHRLTFAEGATVASLKGAVPAAAIRHTTSYQYDGAGRRIEETNQEGTITRYAYDDIDNLVSTTRAHGTDQARVTEARYDVLGRVTQQLTAEGRALITGSMTQAQIDDIWSKYGVAYAYDLAGRKISATVRPNDSQTNKTVYYYDSDGRLRFEVNALGERTEYRYNALDQLTDEIHYASRIATTSLNGGLLTSALITTLTASADNARDARTTFQYTLTGSVLSARIAKTTNNTQDGLTTFTYNAFGQKTVSVQQIDATRSLRHEFTYDTRGLSTLTKWDPSGVNTTESRIYDAFGRVTSTTDARGKSWSVTYDRLGRVVTSTDPGTPARSMTYDAFDRVLTRTDALNNVTTYVYDAANRKVTITSPESIVTSSVSNRHGETVTITDGRGGITSYAYDLNGRLKTVTTPAGTTTHNYDRAGQEIETIDGNGIKTAYTYDAAGRVLTRAVDPTGINLISKTFYDGLGQSIWQQDATGVWTQTQYNRDGEVTAVIVDPLNIPNTASTQTSITLVSNAAGLNLRTDYTYDYRGKTLTVTEGAGSSQPRVTQYTYDVLGRRTQEAVDPSGLNLRTTYTYDAKNNLVAKTDALNAVTRYVYNDKNQLIYSVDGTGAVVKTDYDAEGRVSQTTAYANRISLTSPSALGTAITVADITGRLATSAAADQVARTVYNKDGQVRFTINGANAVTERKYDASGNVIQVTRYATPITVPATVNATTVAAAIVTHANDQTERTVYDAANRATFRIDAAGYVTQSVYDNVGRVIKQVRYANALAGTFTANQAPQIVSTAPASGSYVLIDAINDRTTRTVYDAAGRARFEVDGEGYITERRYDGLDRETRRIQYAAKYTVADGATVASVTAQVPATPGATEPVEQSVYDTAGRLVRAIDAENVTTLHVYDAVGRRTDTTVAHGTTYASTTHRVFNAAGWLIEETAAYGTAEAATSRYVVNAVGNRTQLIDPRGIELAETDSTWAKDTRRNSGYPELLANLSVAQKTALRALYTSTQQFDAAGRITTLTDAAGKSIATQYDAFGNKVRVTDQRGNNGYFYFDRNNRLILQVDPEGYVTQTVYNAFGTVDRIVRYANKVVGTVAVGTAPAIVTAVPNPVTGPYLLSDAARDQTTLIEHDKRDLQTKVTDAENGFETMAYNAFGDKVSYRNKLGSVYAYTFDRVGNVKRETSPSVTVTTVDSAGTPTSSTQALIKEFTYDARGNLTRVREAVGLAQQRDTVITYDRLNRETRRDLPAISVFDPVSKTSSSQTPFTTINYDPRGNVVEQRDAAGGRTIHYYDALNRKTLSVDPTGALSEYSYDDAGNLTKERTYSTRLSIDTVAWATRPAAAPGDTYREMEYVYDANNRCTKAITQAETYFDSARLVTLTNGNKAVTGSGYINGRITTHSVYDATGNVVKTVDGRGYITLYFYNKLGQQILSVDPLGYVTRTEYDGNGNVIRQSKYETKLANATIAALTENSNPQTLITEVAGKGQDRVTEYDYDRLSRKVAERTLSVRYSTVSDAGVVSQTEQAVQTTYQYDAAGNLKQVRKADGAQTDYDYDVLSRLIRQQDPTSTVYNGMSGSTVQTVSARAKTEWQYDALGNRTVQTRFGLTAADNQVTRSRFDVQGNAIAAWDAMSSRTDYDLDAAGRILRQARSAIDVDGVTHVYRTYFTYDALARELTRKNVTDEGAANQVIGDISWSSYNAFGDVSARGLNGTTQAEYRYDKLGNLFWTNADTGTPRAYVYDAAGNAVLEVLQANGTDLNTVSSPAQVAGIDPQLVQMKFSIYDARNQITDVFQAPMDFTDLTGALSASQIEQLANSSRNIPGEMRQIGSDDPAATGTGWILTKSVTGGWSHYWSTSSPVGPQPSVRTNLNPTTVSQAAHGQDPLSLVPWSTDNTYVDSPTQTRRVIVNRTAVLDGSVVRETITTTTETTVTSSSGGNTTTSPDEVDYQTGTAKLDQQTTTTTTTSTLTRKVETVVNTYSAVQEAVTTNELLGGSVIQSSQLGYIAPQTITWTDATVIIAAEGSTVTYATITVPAISGFGSGPTRVLIEDFHGTLYDNANAFGPVSFFGQAYVTRVRVWKGGVLLLDTATTGPTATETRDQGLTTISQYQTARAVAVSGDTSGVASAHVWLGNGQSAPLTRYDFNGGSQWVALGIGTGTESWQYNLYRGDGSLLGAASGGSLSNPASRQLYYRTRTDYAYYRSQTNDSASNESRKTDVTESTQQSNYLRQLLYSIASGTSQSNQIHRSSTYNAFGEVISQTDGRGNVTQYTYNEIGKLIRKQDPSVAYTGEDGVKVNNFTPVTQYYVDMLGQTVGSVDANNFATRQAVRNGQVVAQFNPDGGVERHYYDLFGNQVANTNGIALTTRYQYDKNNRQTRTDFAGGNFDVYEYDALGNRIAHTNGLNYRETYQYDAEGRITRYRSAENRETRYTYTFRTDIGERGGYRKVTTDPLLKTQIDDVDMFGKIRSHTDLGGRIYTYNYNAAGWLLKQTSTAGQNIDYTYYNNGYLKEVKDLGVNSFSLFAYDKDGNRTLESYSAQSIFAGDVAYGLHPHQMAKATYDALNRIVTVEEQGKYRIEYEYDKVSNRRRVKSTYFDLLAETAAAEQQQVQDFWYKYDSMNRFTVTMGSLVGGQIVRGTGYDIGYNAASQRTTQTSTDNAGKAIKETYAYDNNGFLTTVKINPNAGVTAGDGVVRAQRVNNVVGDRTEYYEFNASGVATSRHRYTYDKDHILKQDHDIDNNRGTNYHLLADGRTDKTVSYDNVNSNAATVTFQYAYENWDAYQQKTITVTGIANGVKGWKNGMSTFTYDVNGHVKQLYDHAEDRTIQYVSNQHGQTLKRLEFAGTNTAQKPATLRQFYYFYGRVIGDQGLDKDKVPSRVDYAQALRGTELEGGGNKTYIESKRTDAMTSLWQQWTLGQITEEQWNNGVAANTGSIDAFQHKDIGQRVIAVTSVDFDQNFQPINASFPPSTVGTYVVRTGDTLQSIAASVWGDSSLWYLIAEANGLNGSETLVVDMRLVLPNVVTNIHNNATTFRPLDPSLVLGDTTPTLPDPPPPPAAGRRKGCGVIGMIIVVIVAIVATVFTAGLAAAPAGSSLAAIMSAGAGALGAGLSTTAIIAGAVGAAASQGVAIALGMQKGFDWKGVALGAIGAGVGAGIGELAKGVSSLSWLANTNGWSGFGAQLVRGAIGSAATQGLAVATGLQKQFSWTQVAASAVSSGVGAATGNWLGGKLPKTWGQFTKNFTMNFGTSLASSAAAGLITGQRPNVGAIAAQSFASALGSSIVDATQDSDAIGLTQEQHDEMYQQLQAEFEDGQEGFRRRLQQDYDEHSSRLELERLLDQRMRMDARELNDSLTASLAANVPELPEIVDPDALARGTRAFEAQLDRELRENDIVGNFDRAVDRARQPLVKSNIDPHVDEYLSKLYKTQDSLAARVRDPNIQIGTDRSRWIEAMGNEPQGWVRSRHDGTYVIRHGDHLKPVANGEALLEQQVRDFQDLEKAYYEIPVELRQKQISVADTLTIASLALGVGEVVATARGAVGLARLLGTLGNGAEYASDISRGDYGGLLGDAALNEGADLLKNRLPGTALKSAVALDSLAVDAAQAAQRLPGSPAASRVKPDVGMSDREWLIKQGLNPMVADF